MQNSSYSNVNAKCTPTGDLLFFWATCVVRYNNIIHFQKEKADMEKLKRLLKPEELTATQQTQQERMQYLDQVYQELEAHYKKTIEKMAAS